MLSVVTLSFTFISYLLNIRSSLTIRFAKFTSYLNYGLFSLILIDWLVSQNMGNSWLGIEPIHIFLFLEILVFHYLKTKLTSNIERVDYQPLLQFTFFTILLNNFNVDLFGIYLIGAIFLEFLIKVKTMGRSLAWNEIVLIYFSSILVFFFQFNDRLEITVPLLLLLYLFVARRFPVITESEDMNPFLYPVVARTVVYGVLIGFSAGEKDKLPWILLLAFFVIMYIFSQFFSQSKYGKWSLYNKSIELTYLIIFIAFGKVNAGSSNFLLFLFLSFASLFPLFVIRLNQIRPRVSLFLGGLGLFFLSGLTFGPNKKYLSGLVEKVIFQGNTSYLGAVLILIFLTISSYYLPFLLGNGKKSVVN